MLTLPIETVIFDLDGTLRHSVPSADDTQFRLANEVGADVPPEKQFLGARWAHYYWAQSPELAEDVRTFEKRDDNFWANYLYRYLISLQVSEEQATQLAPKMEKLMQAQYHPENVLYPDVPETLQALREAGFTLGLISNRSTPCQEECKKLGLLQYFDFAYVAAEVGIWKPDPGIFDRALELSSSPPERVVYVGDNYFADIIGAQNAKMQGILLDAKNIFPDAACVVIRSVKGLLPALNLQ